MRTQHFAAWLMSAARSARGRSAVASSSSSDCSTMTGEGIVEFVGHAGKEAAHSGELFTLIQRLLLGLQGVFRLLECRDIFLHRNRSPPVLCVKTRYRHAAPPLLCQMVQPYDAVELVAVIPVEGDRVT